MAFSNTVTDVINVGPGMLMEFGTWDGDSVTTGTISADTTGAFSVGATEIADVVAWGFASDGDNAVIPAKDVNPNQIKITCTSSDTGDYWIMGKAR